MPVVKLVTFDLTNTIIRVSGSVGEHYSKIGSLYGVDSDPNHLTESFNRVFKDMDKELPNFGVQNGVSSYKWWTKVVCDSFRRSGFRGSANALPSIAGHLYKHFTTAETWHVTTGAQCVLDEIRKRNIVVGGISNMDERLHTILTNLSLRHHFNFVVASVDVNCEKPDPRIFHEALKLGKAKPEESVHVGNDTTRDYFGARDVGMAALLYKGENEVSQKVNKNFVINSLQGVLDFIDIQ